MAATMTAGTFGIQIAVAPTATMPAAGTIATATIAPLTRAFSKSFQKLAQFGSSGALMNTIICQERTLAAGASENLNLFDGSLTDILGQSAGLSKILFVHVQQIANPTGTDASSITIGNAAATTQSLWFSNSNGTYTIKGLTGIPLVQGDDTGKTVDASNQLVKVLNNDGVNAASYRFTAYGVHV